MYYPREPQEPSGCAQTVLITRIIIQILAVPLLLILGSITFLLVTFYLFTINPLYALPVVVFGASVIIGAGVWESKRTAKEARRYEDEGS